jgi:hypothetical protein
MESIENVKAETEFFLREAQRMCREAGLKYHSYKQSAMIGYCWGKEDPKKRWSVAVEGWHGTNPRWGIGHVLHDMTLIPPGRAHSEAIKHQFSHCVGDFDFRGSQTIWKRPEAKAEYLKKLGEGLQKLKDFLQTI